MKTNNCNVCRTSIHPLAKLCQRCGKYANRVDIRNRPNKNARIKALRDAWDGNHFKCYYSGVVLEEINSKSPLYVSFDHRTPRDEDDIVVAAACINDMKTDMSEIEFRAVVIALSKAFQGGTIDEKIFNLKYWKR